MVRLWSKTDKRIAEILIEEGFVTGEKVTADGKKAQLRQMQLQAWRDRQWWRQQWRNQKRATVEESNETRGEYFATLNSYQDIGTEMLEDPKMRGTPRVQALTAVAKIEELKAKAAGVAEMASVDPDGDSGPRAPFLGIIVGIKKLTPEAVKAINAWNRKRSKE